RRFSISSSKHPASTDLYTLSLHDALPIFTVKDVENLRQLVQTARTQNPTERGQTGVAISIQLRHRAIDPHQILQIALVSLCLSRSEEHTSELQSLTNLVCRLLLEKKKVRH